MKKNIIIATGNNDNNGKNKAYHANGNNDKNKYIIDGKPRFTVKNRMKDLLLTKEEIERLSKYAFFDIHRKDGKTHGIDRLNEKYHGKPATLENMIKDCEFAFLSTDYNGHCECIHVAIDNTAYLIISTDNGNVITFVVKDNGTTNKAIYEMALKRYHRKLYH